jgi:hypothetical protein
MDVNRHGDADGAGAKAVVSAAVGVLLKEHKSQQAQYQLHRMIQLGHPRRR